MGEVMDDDPTTPVRLAAYTRTDQTEILGDGDDPFGVAGTGLTFLPKDEHFGIRLAGRLVAHAGLLRLSLTVGDTPSEAMGVGGVAVAPDVRGRGLARRVVAAALTHARTQGPPNALLFCRPPLVPFYTHLGWHPVQAPVHVEQHDGPVLMPLHTMRTPLHEDADWPSGTVRLHSFPM
ncbi:GNAT family N-acetyltransferase [Streptomyces sp. NPDC053367]|uniref:GNAT family N-acetyltransferase n=1 Tax=Streptomyces sp. NPDC053367 TaxID=3365700 RepID=UPI0037CD3BE0